MSIILDQYRSLFRFLRSGFKRILLLTTIAACICTAAGLLFGLCSPEWCIDQMQSFNKSVNQTGVILPDGSVSVTTLIVHNWLAMLTMTVSGLIPFLFVPVMYLISNHVLIGSVAALYLHFEMSPALFLAGIVPHGIFEIPAMLLSLSCGFYICFNLYRTILKKTMIPSFADMICNVLRVMLLVTAPLVVAAGIFETYVTPLVQALFM